MKLNDKKRALGDRMKDYEDAFRLYLPKRMPCIIRVDGKAFHTLTRNMEKPFDIHFCDAMLEAAKELCEEIQGAKIAFWQSDEISILLTDYDRLVSQAWFEKNLQKMVSVSASVATVAFNKYMNTLKDGKWDQEAKFDSRVFVLPKEEVCNYFLWRQRDATTNSINSVGQAHFSHTQLHGLNTSQVQEKLFQDVGLNWSHLETWQKRGACIVQNEHGEWTSDLEIPIFSENREYINRFVYIGEE